MIIGNGHMKQMRNRTLFRPGWHNQRQRLGRIIQSLGGGTEFSGREGDGSAEVDWSRVSLPGEKGGVEVKLAKCCDRLDLG